MDNFFHLGTPGGFGTEDEERQDFFSLLAPTPEPEPIEPPQDRSFLERLFAPFEAPQQFLFSLTTELGDGLEIGDIGRAFSHGLRFANPFSNTERINPEEVRQTFFGADKEGEEGNKFLRGVTNVAISLLYDPLLLAPIGKALGLADDAVRTVGRVTNPAGTAIMEGLGLAQRRGVPAVQRAARQVLGDEKAERYGAALGQWLVNRYTGLPEEMRTAIDRLDQGIMRWRTQAHKVLKNAEKLGGKDAQRLMAEALEDEAIWLAKGGDDSARALEEVAKFDRRLEQQGISKDLFWDVYDQSRRLDDTIGEGLVKSGAISGEEFDELRGKHLRRMFLATERPGEYIDKIESLVIPNEERFSMTRFRKGLNEIRSELDSTILRTPKGQATLFSADDLFGGNRYFRDGERTRFNVKAFTDDLDSWMSKNSQTSADDVFSHIQDEMLGGVEMPAPFWERIGNFLNGSYYNPADIQREWVDRLRQWHYTPGFNWHSVNEKLEVVAKRQDIPEEIRAALGEVLDFGPRLAAEATDAGRLLETRQFLDNVAGVVRDESGSVLKKGGNKIAFTAEEARGMKGLVPLRGAHLGELDGMHVKPAVAMYLKRMEGVGNIANPSRQALNSVFEFIRRGTSLFKIHKVILDPAAQVRNFLGNMVLMDMAGVTPLDVGRINKAVVELRDFGKTGNLGKYLSLAEDAGVTMFQHTFAREELQLMARNLGDDLTGDSHKTINGLQRVVRGLKDAYGDSVEYMGNLFEFEEKMFKLSTFIGKYDELIAPLVKRGKSITPELQRDIAKQAGELAERALFNYADIPHLAKFARDYGIVPFITFPMKATSYVGKTLVENPHRVLKYNRGVESYNESMAGSREEHAENIAALPEYARDKLVLRFPWDDDGGRPQYIDLSYFLPWFVVQDIAKAATGGNEEGAPLPRDGLFTPPLLALVEAFRRNEDSLGRPIATADMSGTEKFARYGHFLWQMFAPPDAPGGSRATSIGRAMQAVARSEPETVDWLNFLGGTLSLGSTNDRALSGSGFMPPSQAQVQTGGPGGALLGGLGGLLAVSTIASDAPQQATNAIGKRSASANEIQRQIAQVRTNPNLSPRERVTRIQRLLEQLQESRTEAADSISAMF